MPHSTLSCVKALCNLKGLEHVLLHVSCVPSCIRMHVDFVWYSAIQSRLAASCKTVQSKHASLTSNTPSRYAALYQISYNRQVALSYCTRYNHTKVELRELGISEGEQLDLGFRGGAAGIRASKMELLESGL